tara:strand:+ start:138 stop:689 length:552 start_codon:yes stop_codon:yes gene_type:complete
VPHPRWQVGWTFAEGVSQEEEEAGVLASPLPDYLQLVLTWVPRGFRSGVWIGEDGHWAVILRAQGFAEEEDTSHWSGAIRISEGWWRPLGRRHSPAGGGWPVTRISPFPRERVFLYEPPRGVSAEARGLVEAAMTTLVRGGVFIPHRGSGEGLWRNGGVMRINPALVAAPTRGGVEHPFEIRW